LVGEHSSCARLTASLFGCVLVLAVKAERAGWLPRLACVLSSWAICAHAQPGNVREHACGTGQACTIGFAYFGCSGQAGLAGLPLQVLATMLVPGIAFLRTCVLCISQKWYVRERDVLIWRRYNRDTKTSSSMYDEREARDIYSRTVIHYGDFKMHEITGPVGNRRHTHCLKNSAYLALKLPIIWICPILNQWHAWYFVSCTITRRITPFTRLGTGCTLARPVVVPVGVQRFHRSTVRPVADD
jgi:hypothetical protein